MHTFQNNDRFHANMEALACVDAALVADLRGITPSRILVSDGGGGLNVDLGDGTLLYPHGAEAATRRQVEEFLQAPLRYVINIGSVFADCIEINKTYDAMRDGVASFPKRPAFGEFGGFLIIFGLGLGLHMERLVKATRFKTLIVIEPHDELTLHSCHAMDWAELLKGLERNGQRIKFVRGDQIFAKLTELVRGDVFYWGQLMAAALLGSIPVAIVYSFFVEHYVAGLTAGSVKA